jgi:Flp pilus assembly protein TadD
MYAPIAGLILAMLALAVRLHPRGAALRAVAIVILAACCGLSWHRSEVWVSDLTFWGDAVEKNPRNGRAFDGLGSALMRRQDCSGAVRAFQSARSREPADLRIAWNLAGAYQCNQDAADALMLFRTIAATQPSADAYDHIGYLAATLGHESEAIEAIASALRLDPNDATAYAYRGLTKLAVSDNAGAAADFRHALELDPANPAAAAGMARLPAAGQ